MQFLHDVMAMHEVLIKYVDLNNTWESRLKEVEDWVTRCDRCLKEAFKQESKLKEDLVAIHDSHDTRETIIRGLEVWMVKKDGVLTVEQAHAAEVEARLN